LPVLVRSWNLFHGNTVPPTRRDALARMVALAAEGGPQVVCLQEVPPWALERLSEWSGLVALGDVARHPSLGPLPSTPELGRLVTSLHHGLLRSAFTGQASAVLLGAGLRVLERHVLELNDRHFRRAQAEWLGLPLLARLAWARERRVAQVLRLALPDGRTLTLANVHATYYRPDERLADAELLRAAVFVDAVAEPGDVVVLAGDFNVRSGRSATLAELRGWGYGDPGPGIDHVLVRGAEAAPLVVWPPERRTDDGGALLSDHAPVELSLS
jgi:endonuclease/exonuclease/phosphatase family metal-dependent hydrolase